MLIEIDAVVLIVSINDALDKDVRTQPVVYDQHIVSRDIYEDFAEEIRIYLTRKATSTMRHAHQLAYNLIMTLAF